MKKTILSLLIGVAALTITSKVNAEKCYLWADEWSDWQILGTNTTTPETPLQLCPDINHHHYWENDTDDGNRTCEADLYGWPNWYSYSKEYDDAHPGIKNRDGNSLTYDDENWQYKTNDGDYVTGTDKDHMCVLGGKPEMDYNSSDNHRSCGATQPAAPQWMSRYNVFGGTELIWSAMGGSKIDIEMTNPQGEFEYRYTDVSNNGHKFLPNVGRGQGIRVRVVNDCERGDWLVDW